MTDHAAPKIEVTRREVVSGGALLAAAVLAGCAGGRAAEAPGMRWPDAGQDPVARPTPTPPMAYQPPTPLPAPAPVSGVLPRSSWTTQRPIQRLADPMLPITRITVHHDGMPPTTLRSQGQVASRIEQIRSSHVQRGWADIGYHFVIDPQGRVWEGRPTSLQGAHVQDNNPGNLGVLVLGNFDQQSPTPDALNTLDSFLAQQMGRYRVPISRVFTHQEIRSTACPGRNLQRYMLATRASSGRLRRLA